VVGDPVVELAAGVADGRMMHGWHGSGHYLLPTWIMRDIALKPDLR